MTTRTAFSLEGVFGRIARVIARDFGVKVRLRGTSAYATEEGSINLPNIGAGIKSFGSKMFQILLGYLYHEVGHVKFTDWSLMKPYLNKAKNKKLAKAVWNTIEDPMVERNVVAYRPGAGGPIDDMNDHHFAECVKRSGALITPVDRSNVSSRAVWGLQLLLYGRATMAQYKEKDPEAHAALELIVDLVPEASEVMTTSEAIYFSEQILVRWGVLDEEDVPDKHERPEEDKSDSEDSSEGGDPSEGDGDPAPADGDPQEGEGDPGEGEGDPQEGEGDPEDSPFKGHVAAVVHALLTDEDVEYEHPGASSVQQLIFDNLPEAAHGEYQVFTHDFDWVYEVNAYPRDPKHVKVYERVMSETREHVGVLARRLESIFLAEVERRIEYELDEGDDLDDDALAGFTTGVDTTGRVFQQEVVTEMKDVAVSLVVDCSGSMGVGHDSPSDLARQAAAIYHEVLVRLDIPHEVVGFTTDRVAEWDPDNKVASLMQGLHAAYQKSRTEPNGGRFKWSRCTSIVSHAVFVPFGSEDGHGIGAISGYRNNLDGEALMWAASRLAEREEVRKLMLVFSDGQPAGGDQYDMPPRHLRMTVPFIENAGIEVYGIGIKNESVREFYSRHCVVDSLEQLPAKTLRLLMGAILQQEVT